MSQPAALAIPLAPSDDTSLPTVVLPTRRDAQGTERPVAPAARPGWDRLYSERGMLQPTAITPFACFERADGAVVAVAHGPEARPWRAGHKAWAAWGPDGQPLSMAPRSRRRGGTSQMRQLRRWKSAAAAMAAVDRELPRRPRRAR